MQLFFAHGFQIEGTAHAVIKDKNRLLNTKAPLQTGQKSLQGRRIGPISAQHLQVNGHALCIGGHRQQDLGTIFSVIAAVAVGS
jgi:hypothetical protein